LLSSDEQISESLSIWADRYKGISQILDGANKAVSLLVNKSEGFKQGAPKGLENIRDAILENVIPVVRGIHAAFKELPLLEPEEEISESLQIWADRYKGISAILTVANKAVDILVNKSEGFKQGAPKGLIAIRDAITENVIPVVRGIHAAFKELPLLLPEEEIGQSLALWAERYKGISDILDGANDAVKILESKSEWFKGTAAGGLENIRDAVVEQVLPTIRGVHAAFKELPILLPEEEISTSLTIWAERYEGISGILDAVLQASDLLANQTESLAAFEGMTVVDIRDAILNAILPVVRGIHAAFKELPLLDEAETISTSLGIWSDRMKAIFGIVKSVVDIASEELIMYTSPDVGTLRQIATDAQLIMDEMQVAAEAMYTSAEDMTAKLAVIDAVSGVVGTIKDVLLDTIDVAKKVTDAAAQSINAEDVAGFTNNLANMVAWMTDPVTGLTAITNLGGLAGYELATGAMRRIVAGVVDAIGEILTLPAIWDDRLTTMGAGISTFLADLSVGFESQGAQIGRSVYLGIASSLNSGVFRELGVGNANAYEAGWLAALEIGSPSKAFERMRQDIMAGLNGGYGGDTTNYNLHVTTTANSEVVTQGFNTLRAMSGA